MDYHNPENRKEYLVALHSHFIETGEKNALTRVRSIAKLRCWLNEYYALIKEGAF